MRPRLPSTTLTVLLFIFLLSFLKSPFLSVLPVLLPHVLPAPRTHCPVLSFAPHHLTLSYRYPKYTLFLLSVFVSVSCWLVQSCPIFLYPACLAPRPRQLLPSNARCSIADHLISLFSFVSIPLLSPSLMPCPVPLPRPRPVRHSRASTIQLCPSVSLPPLAPPPDSDFRGLRP